jgi:hypothetical protein
MADLGVRGGWSVAATRLMPLSSTVSRAKVARVR